MVDQIDDFAQLLGIYRTRAGFTQGELARKMRMSRNTIVAWENNTSRPDSRGHVLRLADELILSKDERETLLKAARKSTERWPTEVWTVPQQKDMFFTGREEVLQLLRALLVPGSAAALTQSISGLGGVGKTHTAVEYAYRYGAYYEAVLWLQADSWEILSSECATLACELGVADLDEHDTMRAVDTVKHWLRTHRYWLLILDNVEDLHLLSQFIPTNHQGSVLITTRVQNPEPLAQTQVLPEMSEQEGILFLLRRTKRVAPNAGLEQASVDHYHEARQIGKLLDGLPLALDQAGAYILETGCSFTAYGKKYEQYRAELLARRGNRFIGHKASVMTTFSLAFDRVISLNPMVADILHVCALLYNEAIPEELFEIGAPSLGPRWAQGPGEWDLAVGMLQDYSLLQRHRNKTLSIHRVVQAVLRESLSKQEEHTWQERIVQILAMPEVFPYPEFKTWDQCKRVLPHALECLHWQNSKTYESDNMTYIALFTAHYLLEHAQHKEAEPLLLQLRETTEQHSDFALLDIVFSMLANLYHFQGQYTEAETWYKLALGASQYLWDLVHTGMVEPIQQWFLEQQDKTLSNFATLYVDQGRYAEAEPLYKQLLLLAKQTYGANHPHTAQCLHNLAVVYRDTRNDAEAEPLFLQALAIREQVLGPEHPDVAITLAGLAALYMSQGNYQQAESLYQRAVHSIEQALGSEHPYTGRILYGLATLYLEQKIYEEAEARCQQALAIFEQQLEPNYPNIAAILHNLATFYLEQKNYGEAEARCQQALAIREAQLGANHPDTAESLIILALIEEHQGKYAEAQPYLARALRITETLMGQDHPSTQALRTNYALLVRIQGEETEGRGNSSV